MAGTQTTAADANAILQQTGQYSSSNGVVGAGKKALPGGVSPGTAPTVVAPAASSSPGAAIPGAPGGGTTTVNGGLPSGADPGTATDPAYNQAEQDIEPMSEDQIYAYWAGKSSSTLDAIRSTASAAELAATNQESRDISAANADNASRGMVGNPTSVATSKAITDQQEAIANAEAQKNQGIATVAADIASKTEADFKENQEVIGPNYIALKKNDLNNALTGLVSSGGTLTDLQNNHPNEYGTLLQYAGGDPNALNALYISASKNSLLNNGQPISTIGNTFVYGSPGVDANGNPTIKTTSVTIQDLPPNYKVSSYNQAANGTVTYVAFPTDASGNQTVDPSKPNNGVISGVIGDFGAPGTDTSSAATDTTTPTSPDQVQNNILSATGLSIQAFNYLTQGSTALARLPAGQRNAIMAEAQNWAKNKNVDLSTLQTQYSAYNTTLQNNIQRFNNTTIAENELMGTADNLLSTISDSDFSNIKPKNVALLFAGKQVNDPTVTKYSAYLSQLRTELAYYYAATEGKSSPEQSEEDQAASVITDGLSSGSVSAFKDYVKATTDKMKGVLQKSVDDAQQNVWNIFGVTKGQSSSGGSSLYPAGSVVQDASGNKYTVGSDGETLTPQ